MEDLIQELKLRARHFFDERIQHARDEYADAMAEIEEVRRQMAKLEKKPSKRIVGIMAIVREIVPRDREFSATEIFNRVRSKHPNLPFDILKIRNALSGMVRTGDLIRTQKGSGHRKSIFAHKEYDAPLRPFGNTTQIRLVERVVKDAKRPMNGPEIVVEMQARGYKVEDPPALVESVLAGMKQKPSVFVSPKRGWWDVIRDNDN